MRKRPPPRTLDVLSKTQFTTNMLRITLGGSGLLGFPDEQDGAYVKLRLGESGPDGKPLVRTYTVRSYRSGASEIDIDFVLHDVEGPAADWARNCKPGDQIKVGGPGPKKIADPTADWFLFAGDMSALPAIGANLDALRRDARGYALLEIINEDDKQEIDAPDGLQIQWIVNPHPDETNTILLDAVRQLEWLEGQPYAWVAGEFSQSLAIRKWLREERGMIREQMYASSYWQIGQTEDGHRVSKANAQPDRGR